MSVEILMKIPGVDGEALTRRHEAGIELNSTLGYGAALQIKDPKIGQEIHLPTHPNPKSENSIATPPVIHAKDLPKPPIGDPIAASVMKAILNAACHLPSIAAPQSLQIR